MNSLSTTGLPRPLPTGVAAEVTPLGVRVTLAAGSASSFDRRIGKGAIVQGAVVFIVFAAFFGYGGVCVSARAASLADSDRGGGPVGDYFVVAARGWSAKRQSQPAMLELAGGRLIIDEPGFNLNRQRRIVGVAPLHMEYALADLAAVMVSNRDDDLPFESALQLRMTNRLSNYHLKGRPANQLEWAARWLAEVLRTAERGGPSST